MQGEVIGVRLNEWLLGAWKGFFVFRCREIWQDERGQVMQICAALRQPGRVRKSGIALAYSSPYMTITIAEEDGTYSHLDRQHM